MFRVVKVLNHNSIIVLDPEEQKRFLVLYRGIGFHKKTSERIEVPEESVIYSLERTLDRGDAMSIVNHVEPECLEIAGAVLAEAEKTFGKVDRNIVFPMADHLSFAVRRMREGEEIRNPLKEDIRLLFHAEYKVSELAVSLVREKCGVQLTDDEVGFLALHVHSSIENENVSQALQTAQIVRSCISFIEQKTGQTIEVTSLGYNRMMNHIRYMVTRLETGEEIKMNLNDYMLVKYPEVYHLSEEVCNQISRIMKKEYHDSEIGYLAMHIARVIGEE